MLNNNRKTRKANNILNDIPLGYVGPCRKVISHQYIIDNGMTIKATSKGLLEIISREPRGAGPRLVLEYMKNNMYTAKMLNSIVSDTVVILYPTFLPWLEPLFDPSDMTTDEVIDNISVKTNKKTIKIDWYQTPVVLQ